MKLDCKLREAKVSCRHHHSGSNHKIFNDLRFTLRKDSGVIFMWLCEKDIY